MVGAGGGGGCGTAIVLCSCYCALCAASAGELLLLFLLWHHPQRPPWSVLQHHPKPPARQLPLAPPFSISFSIFAYPEFLHPSLPKHAKHHHNAIFPHAPHDLKIQTSTTHPVLVFEFLLTRRAVARNAAVGREEAPESKTAEKGGRPTERKHLPPIHRPP